MREKIRKILQDRLESLGIPGGALSFSLGPPPDGIAGDLSTNAPLLMAKPLKTPPHQLAAQLIAALSGAEGIEKAELAGPGFVNLVLKKSWIVSEFHEILRARDLYAQRPAGGGKKMLIEFVSANPTGPLHVGHGRGAALGDSLARIFRHLGHDVQTEYYVNDVGNQMQNLGLSVMKQCEDMLSPDEKMLLEGRDPADLYKGDYIRELAEKLRKKRTPNHFVRRIRLKDLS